MRTLRLIRGMLFVERSSGYAPVDLLKKAISMEVTPAIGMNQGS